MKNKYPICYLKHSNTHVTEGNSNVSNEDGNLFIY